MNFSFMSFSCPELDLLEFLALAKRLGYAGVEPRAQCGHGHAVELDTTPEQRRGIRTILEDSGVPFCCLAVSCCYADPATVEEHLEDTRRAIDLAGDLDCPRLRVFGGEIGEGLSRRDAVEQLAGALASVAGQAAERGVTVCVETHDDWRDPKDVAAVMAQVDHPSIAVNWDIMHPILAGAATMEEAFNTLRPWIRHVHVHDGRSEEDGNVTLLPIGDGVIDHATGLRCLRESGYDGYVSGEWIEWEHHEVHLPRELARLQALA